MYHHLSIAVRDRVIRELRGFWSDHPRYPNFAQNIQGKYAFDERPQFGMIVKTGGASNVILDSNNFIGTVEGYVSLAQFPNKPYLGSVEWVREDPMVSPSEMTPGIYHLTIFETDGVDPTKRAHDVYYERYRRVREDALVFQSDTEIILSGEPIENSLRVLENPSQRFLGLTEYVLEGNKITLTEASPRGTSLYVTYTEKMEREGPFRVEPSRAYREIIKGATIVFGRRLQHNDECAVIVAEEREEISHEYGGRWDVSLDIDIIARDVHSQADISDQTAVWIWSTLRPKFASMGMELSDVSLGGEAEEVYDDNGDDYFFTASISFTMQVDWFIHFPLLVPIQSISTYGVQLVPLQAPVRGNGSKTTELIQRLL
jgi:hypothetical protein